MRLALISGLLAAASGSTLIVSSNEALAAGLALGAAAASTALTALRPGDVATRHKRGADGFAAMRTRFIGFRDVSVNTPERRIADLQQELDALFDRRDAMADDVPVVSGWAKRKEERRRAGRRRRKRDGMARKGRSAMLRRSTHTFDGLPYLLFTPDAPEDSADRLPLIIFLHGRGESAGDELSERSLAKLEANGLPRLAANGGLPLVCGRDFRMLVACPQTAHYWKPRLDDVTGLIDELIEKRRADPARCYLTGISMGAIASWELARQEPGRFAALVPISGEIPPAAMDARDIPAWVVAGGLDEHYPIREVQSGVDALRTRGAEIILTVDPDAHHRDTFWNDIYARSHLYEWLSSHAREVP